MYRLAVLRLCFLRPEEAKLNVARRHAKNKTKLWKGSPSTAQFSGAACRIARF